MKPAPKLASNKRSQGRKRHAQILRAGRGGRARCRLCRRMPRRPRSSRSAFCLGSSIRSTRSCSSAWKRRPRISASRSSPRFRRPGASRRRRRFSIPWSRAATSTTSSPPPTDKDQMVGPLKAAVDAGIKVITVDTLPRRRRLRERPGQIPDQLHRLRQYRGRPHRRARAGQGDRRQGNRLHQLDQPQRQLGRGPREGLQGGDGEGLSEHQGARPRLQSRRPQQGDAADRGGAGARTRSCRRVRHQRVQRARARARRSSTPGSAATCRLSPTTPRSRRSN